MAVVDMQRLGWVERRSPSLFLLAAASLLVVLAITTFERVTGTAIPDLWYWPLFPFGVAAALAGLIGLSPQLVERASRAAKLGLGFALSGVVMLVGGLGVLLVTAPSGSYPASLGPIGALFLLGLGLFVLAFGTYGVAGLRTATPSRGVGSLLLGVAGIQVVELAGALFLFPAADARSTGQIGWFLAFEAVTYGAIIAALFSIGYVLQTDTPAPELDEREPDLAV